MSWSYTGNPGDSAKDAVRFLIGDTSECDQLMQDGEIAWVLGQYNNAPMNAAIRCAETIIAKFARMADETVGRVSISYSQKAKGFRELRADLVRRLATEDMTPYAGGITVTDMEQNDLNNNLIKPDFSKHMMENNQISPWVTNSLNTFLHEGD